ncbi:MAG TPA: efflux RND transporter periplasmic adaptor subunit [Roseomonas sp.]|nr:efflux RND transporter periplasmic adaptor subunit [Roseomonas sp.]
MVVLALLAVGGGYGAVPAILGPVIVPIPVTRGELVQSVVANGRVETPHRVNIGSQVTGTVAEVPVEQGQTVAAQQMLVVLDDRESQASVEQSQGAVAQAEARLRQMTEVTLPLAREALQAAEANLVNARQQHERAEQLRSGGFETQAQLQNLFRALLVAQAAQRQARVQVANSSPGGTEYVVAETALRQARASLLVALSRQEYTRIRAPVAGTLIARNVERGWVVQPSQVLMVLSPAGETQIVVQIDERNLGRMAIGQRALASADAYPDRRFEAVVSYINPSVDPQRAAVEVKLAVPRPPDYLRQDMTVSVDVAVAQRADALVLPATAVRNAAGANPWVLRIEQGRARRRAVRIGLRGVHQVEILDGIAQGDLVVPATAAVADGGRLRIGVAPSAGGRP